MNVASTLVILGASGDLTRRLLFPALYRLELLGKLPEFKFVGYALEKWSEDRFRAHLRDNLRQFAAEFSESAWDRLAPRISYRSGEVSVGALSALKDSVPGPGLFYLALPPGAFAQAAAGLAGAGLNREETGWRRLLIEKPFGQDLNSAQTLNQAVHRHWREDQVLRIDHFLGKETVQNLIVFRFANRFLDPVLCSHHIAQVQITVAETLGLESRYRYYDHIGALRDMIQNHLMQLFTLIAMEPPPLWDSEVLREHKVEVLKTVHPIGKDVDRWAVRGQYTAGSIDGKAVPGYLEENSIPPSSITETFAAVKLSVDNWRWKGVPFYLRTGKRLKRDMSEIAVQFKEPPTRLFQKTSLERLEPNWLIFCLKPEEAVDLTALAKRPGLGLESRTVVLRTPYARQGETESSAYEQLLLDAIEGDRAPFLRFDEVEWAWKVLGPVLKNWASGPPDQYPAGSEGPLTQKRILEPGHDWRHMDKTAL